MIRQDAATNPPKLWLAGIGQQGGGSPDEQGSSRSLGTQALRVLVVEDEFFISLHTKTLLEDLGHVVVGIAVSAEEAVSIAAKEQPDVVLMDIRLAGARDGIDAALEIRRSLGIGSIFVTANSDPQTRQRAEAAEPFEFLEKPLTEERLRHGLDRLTAQ